MKLVEIAAGRFSWRARDRRLWPTRARAVAVAVAVASSSGAISCQCRPPSPSPGPAPQAEQTPAPSTSLEHAAGGASVPFAEQPVSESLPAKLAAYRAYLDDADLTLHALRISWPGARTQPWRWPSWLSPDEADRALDAMAKLGGTPPQIPAVDAAARRYVEIVRPELLRWRSLFVEASTAPRWDDEVVASFDRFVTASLALRDAVAAAPDPEPPPRSYGAMVKACRAGSELAARATWFAQLPAEAGSAAPSMPTSTVEVAPIELHRAGLACHRATLAFLEARAPDDYETNPDFRLHVSMATSLIEEAERRARARRYLSTFPSYAQNAAYAARRRHRFVAR
ncbi:MAG TPA: hypothetical protein VNO30_29830 [Kofleriaceae bacterium]|nr:hypothetical protein [Kofleriaceae bacterium]